MGTPDLVYGGDSRSTTGKPLAWNSSWLKWGHDTIYIELGGRDDVLQSGFTSSLGQVSSVWGSYKRSPPVPLVRWASMSLGELPTTISVSTCAEEWELFTTALTLQNN